MFSISDVSVAWAFVWAWIVANLAMVISSVSVVIISIPVLYFSAKAIRHTCRAGGIVSRIIVYLRRQAPAPPATRAPRDAMEVLEEVRSIGRGTFDAVASVAEVPELKVWPRQVGRCVSTVSKCRTRSKGSATCSDQPCSRQSVGLTLLQHVADAHMYTVCKLLDSRLWYK